MNIEIHRGSHQIGGCVTEYEHDGWHLFVDYGEELPGGPKTGDLQVEGLTKGDLSKVTEVLSLVTSNRWTCYRIQELKLSRKEAHDDETTLS